MASKIKRIEMEDAISYFGNGDEDDQRTAEILSACLRVVTAYKAVRRYHRLPPSKVTAREVAAYHRACGEHEAALAKFEEEDSHAK